MCRLKLADILVRPMQRLTKYSLLLSAIRKHITEESEAEIMDSMVSLYIFHPIECLFWKGENTVEVNTTTTLATTFND